MTNDPNHRRFLSHLGASKDAVGHVATWLKYRGYVVRCPEGSAAPEHSAWRQHADSGDLFIEQRIEVKRLSVSFTSAANWPFGEKFIVCAKHAFDRAMPKPFAFFVLSRDMKTAAVVETRTKREWYVEERTDRRYDGVSQHFYFAPLSVVRFMSLDVPEAEAR